MNELLIASILGIVEGVTEFLPISSTGHLIVVGHYLQFVGARADTFEVFIQLGAILAVVILYFKRFRDLFDLSGKGGKMAGIEGMMRIGAACFPAFVLGALFHKYIKLYLFSPLTVAVGFVVGALLIIYTEKRNSSATSESKVNSVGDLSLRQCMGIGLFQCLALWPGMSRSGSTIVGGMLLGCSRVVAAEFSFLVAVPVMVAAVGLDMVKSFHLLQREDIAIFSVGFLVSLVSALFAIRALIGFLSRYSLIAFAVYRIIFGIVILYCLEVI